MAEIKKPRGTLDILPEETRVWRYVEGIIREKAAMYGFEEIRFPTFEVTELFDRGVGDTTDIVQKEMYTFTDRDGRSLSLRPEGTSCVARSIIENGLYAGAMPLKLYYLTNFFRYEKPQAGRSREFVQFGTEVFGTDGAEGDVTVIALADAVLRGVGLKSCKLNINSIGCPECRPAFKEKLVEYFKDNEQYLCPTCRERLKTNPLRILDCKDPGCIALAENAPKPSEHLCAHCSDNFEKLKKLLDACGIEYTVNPKIVRGLDYYTGTVFEFISDAIGAQGTVCGGGRYGGLLKQIGGPDMSGVGFGMGITRLLLAMESEGVLPKLNSGADIYIGSAGEEERLFAFGLAQKLRESGVNAQSDIVGRSVKSQMKYADKSGAKYSCVIGSNEINAGEITVNNMETGEKTMLSLDKEALCEFLKKADK